MRNIASVPRVSLGLFPTPFYKLEAISARYGRNIWIKRDDLCGVALGGNKVRKLEFLLAQAQADGCDTVFTTGGAQSNHAMLTAACCAKLGMKAVLFLKERGVTEEKGNLLLDRLLGAEVRFVDTDDYGEVYAQMDRLAAQLRAEGHVPYAIPLGGSTALGVLGYVAGMEEAYGQGTAMGISFDHTVCVCGSGGTTAGVVLGTHLYSPGTRVLAVAVDDQPFDQIVADLVQGALALLERTGEAVPPPEIRSHVGEGYGIPGPEVTAAVEELARLEGIFLDPVYTGKAFAEVLSLLREGKFPGERILFLHSGGAGGLFAVDLP